MLVFNDKKVFKKNFLVLQCLQVFVNIIIITTTIIIAIHYSTSVKIQITDKTNNKSHSLQVGLFTPSLVFFVVNLVLCLSL